MSNTYDCSVLALFSRHSGRVFILVVYIEQPGCRIDRIRSEVFKTAILSSTLGFVKYSFDVCCKNSAYNALELGLSQKLACAGKGFQPLAPSVCESPLNIVLRQTKKLLKNQGTT